MEKVLAKLAKQLNAFDEASLMSLWDKYAAQVQRFEPTRRWEEAALVFGFIQALRWKNQLFNYHWAQGVKPAEQGDAPPPAPFLEDVGGSGPGGDGPDGAKERAKVLRFRPRQGDDPV